MAKSNLGLPDLLQLTVPLVKIQTTVQPGPIRECVAAACGPRLDRDQF